jgi:hypothetical protein
LVFSSLLSKRAAPNGEDIAGAPGEIYLARFARLKDEKT